MVEYTLVAKKLPAGKGSLLSYNFTRPTFSHSNLDSDFFEKLVKKQNKIKQKIVSKYGVLIELTKSIYLI